MNHFKTAAVLLVGTSSILTTNSLMAGIEVYPFTNSSNYTESDQSLTDIHIGLGRLAVIHSPHDIPGDIHASRDAAIGDFNNDGNNDIYSTCAYNSCDKLYLGDGTGGFTTNNVATPTFVNHFRVSASDFNGDGNLDVYISTFGYVSENTLLLGDGQGAFVANNIPGDMSNASDLVVGDFNNDNNQDLYVANFAGPSSNGQNSLLLGAGGGSFVTANIQGDTGSTTAVTTADFNNDGNLDLFTNYPNRIYFGDGTGSFPTSVTHNALFQSFAVTSGDFNSDNKADLYVARTGGVNELYFGDGTGGFTLSNAMSNIAQSFDVNANDFNDDGYLDLYVANNGQNKMYLGDGNGSFSSNDIIGDLGPSFAVNSGDLNNDGIADIYISNDQAGYQNRLYLSGYSTLAPSIQANIPFDFTTPLTDFIEILSPNNEGKVVYQFSLDYGVTWKFYDGTGWSDTAQTDGSEANLAYELNSAVMDSLAPSGSVIWRAYLLSDGTQKVEIDTIIIANRQP